MEAVFLFPFLKALLGKGVYNISLPWHNSKNVALALRIHFFNILSLEDNFEERKRRQERVTEFVSVPAWRDTEGPMNPNTGICLCKWLMLRATSFHVGKQPDGSDQLC